MNDNMIISDELLAAFLDGNTNAEDTMRVLKAAEQDEELRELIRIVSEVDEDMAGRKPAKVKELPMTAMAARKKESYLCDIECEEFCCINSVLKQPTKPFLTRLTVIAG